MFITLVLVVIAVLMFATYFKGQDVAKHRTKKKMRRELEVYKELQKEFANEK